MRRTVGLLASAAIVVCAAIAINGLWQRHQCSLQEAQAEREITRLFDHAEQPGARIMARKVLEMMDRCVVCAPTEVSHHMARAAALRMLGQPGDAAQEYRRALQLDRRAELFLNVGMAELEAGRAQQADDALTTAMLVYYSNYDLMPVPAKFHAATVINPIYEQIKNRQASAALMRELFDRVARLPMD
jgi:Tfp pilus assembly protein PilF